MTRTDGALPSSLNESTRPRAALGLSLAPAQQAAGRHLRAIHDAFRAELTALENRVAEVRRGEASAADVRAAVNAFGEAFGGAAGLTLGQHCAQLCRFVTMHHTLEDSSMFPALKAHARLGPVVDRLREEHLVIHGHLEHLDELATRTDAEPEVLPVLEEAVTTFCALLRSHFTYEEDELSEPLGLLGLL